ncbi:MAG: hypothetical protein ACI8P0_001121 [Planctomycetaceae bacterium]|jgi:hypothetical protein
MFLNDLLEKQDIDTKSVLVLRHRPNEGQLNRVLPWLAAESPDVFNAYQQAQGERVEKAMSKASYVASFIGHEPGKAIFIGLYTVNGSKPLTRKQFWRVKTLQELRSHGMRGFTDDDKRDSLLWFDLRLTAFYSDWKGRLVVNWPGKEVSWWRWSDRNNIAVSAITQDSLLSSKMPKWDALDLSWSELSILPSEWKTRLSEWRAIYFIFDPSDGKGYVGSAYGEENLIARWLGYAATGHGGNRLLRKRSPNDFRFTILQRVSPDMEPADVIRLESSWKRRLHTRHPFGLNDN